MLISCAEQLGLIFNHIFQLSLNHQWVPEIWKPSTIIPMAKHYQPKVLNDFIPIALTSLVMKCFERLIKKSSSQKKGIFLNPYSLQSSKWGVVDATATLLNLILKHLEGNKNFQYAVNTIQPHILDDQFLTFGLDCNRVGWILDSLTDRTQRESVNGCLSEEMSSSTGSPQGCVLSPLLYSLYTEDCRSQCDNRYTVF